MPWKKIGTYELVMTYQIGVEKRAKPCYYIVDQREGIEMKLLEKHVRLVIAVLVLIIVMLSLALWSSTYINNLDTYYFNEYLDSAEQLEH